MSAMDLLGMLAQLSGKAMLCMLILMLPTLLLSWTLLVICRRGHFRDSGVLFLLNFILFAGIAAFAMTSGQGTYFKVAEFSYQIVFVCAFLFIAPVYYNVVMHYYGPQPQEIEPNRRIRSTYSH